MWEWGSCVGGTWLTAQPCTLHSSCSFEHSSCSILANTCYYTFPQSKHLHYLESRPPLWQLSKGRSLGQQLDDFAVLERLQEDLALPLSLSLPQPQGLFFAQGGEDRGQILNSRLRCLALVVFQIGKECWALSQHASPRHRASL